MRVLVAIALAVLLGDAAFARQTTRLPRTWTFDTGSVSTNFDGFNNTTSCALTSSGAHVGQSLRCPLVSGTQSDNYGDFYFGDHTGYGGPKVEEVWVLLWSKFDAGLTWPSSTQKILLLNLTDGSSSARRYQVMLDVRGNAGGANDGEYFVETSDIDDFIFTGHWQNRNGAAVDPTPGGWDKLKLYVLLNTPGVSNGVIRLWINGVLKLENTSANIREATAYGMNKMILSTYATANNPSSGVQWHDELTISATDPEASSAVPPRRLLLLGVGDQR